MSRVRISVDSKVLGDVEVVQEESIEYYDEALSRQELGELILRALAVVQRAYGIEVEK